MLHSNTLGEVKFITLTSNQLAFQLCPVHWYLYSSQIAVCIHNYWSSYGDKRNALYKFRDNPRKDYICILTKLKSQDIKWRSLAKSQVQPGYLVVVWKENWTGVALQSHFHWVMKKPVALIALNIYLSISHRRSFDRLKSKEQHLSFLRHDTFSLTDTFTSVMGTSLNAHAITDCWWPVTIDLIPKLGNFVAIAKRFLPNTFKSSRIKLPRYVVLKRLTFMIPPDNPLQLAHNSYKSSLNAVVFASSKMHR